MILIIGLVAIGVAYYYYYSSSLSDPVEVSRRYANCSAEQKKVIRYFAIRNCLTKKISDQEYDAIVMSYIKKQDFKRQAMSKIGLEESEIQEIEPVHFESWAFGEADNVSFAKKGIDEVWRSTAYQVSWLFFSSSKMYLYQNTVHFDKDNKKVAMEEYYYKDITSFAASTDIIESPTYWNIQQKKWLLETINCNRFVLTVQSNKFYCSMEQNEYAERSIQAMKTKLREKKG